MTQELTSLRQELESMAFLKQDLIQQLEMHVSRSPQSSRAASSQSRERAPFLSLSASLDAVPDSGRLSNRYKR